MLSRKFKEFQTPPSDSLSCVTSFIIFHPIAVTLVPFGIISWRGGGGEKKAYYTFKTVKKTHLKEMGVRRTFHVGNGGGAPKKALK